MRDVMEIARLPQYTDLQLDALGELANIGSGNAGTALSTLLNRPVDISVPRAAVMPLADAIASAGLPADRFHAIVVPIFGDLSATALLLFGGEDAQQLCGVFGIDADTADGVSMLGEVGNIVGATYVRVLGEIIGREMEPAPPQIVQNVLAGIVETVLAEHGDTDMALILDSAIRVEGGEKCGLSFILAPSAAGVQEMLTCLGV